MAVSTDLIQAKQVLSSRLLRAGARGQAVNLSYSIRVSDAIVSSAHNVHAVGVGRKIVEGKVTGDAAVRIYVAQKIAPSLLPPRDLLPEAIDGVPTDVIESPPAFLTARKARATALAQSCTDNRRKRQRPVVAGTSAAHQDVTAGTIACFCRSTRHGDDPAKVYVLSNNHVFANVNQAQVGDNLHQPGPADGGTTSDHFAELHRFVKIALGGSTPNRVDAAIGELLPGIEFQSEVCRIGRIEGTSRAVERLEVRKHGRTTGLTEGVVTDEPYDALVGMDHNNPAVVALFENQMRIDRSPPHPSIGLGGDSGSLIVSKSEAKAVGLYFAGPDSGVYGVANHIADVLVELQIELL